MIRQKRLSDERMRIEDRCDQGLWKLGYENCVVTP